MVETRSSARNKLRAHATSRTGILPRARPRQNATVAKKKKKKKASATIKPAEPAPALVMPDINALKEDKKRPRTRRMSDLFKLFTLRGLRERPRPSKNGTGLRRKKRMKERKKSNEYDDVVVSVPEPIHAPVLVSANDNENNVVKGSAVVMTTTSGNTDIANGISMAEINIVIDDNNDDDDNDEKDHENEITHEITMKGTSARISEDFDTDTDNKDLNLDRNERKDDGGNECIMSVPDPSRECLSMENTNTAKAEPMPIPMDNDDDVNDRTLELNSNMEMRSGGGGAYGSIIVKDTRSTSPTWSNMSNDTPSIAIIEDDNEEDEDGYKFEDPMMPSLIPTIDGVDVGVDVDSDASAKPSAGGVAMVERDGGQDAIATDDANSSIEDTVWSVKDKLEEDGSFSIQELKALDMDTISGMDMDTICCDNSKDCIDSEDAHIPVENQSNSSKNAFIQPDNFMIQADEDSHVSYTGTHSFSPTSNRNEKGSAGASIAKMSPKTMEDWHSCNSTCMPSVQTGRSPHRLQQSLSGVSSIHEGDHDNDPGDVEDDKDTAVMQHSLPKIIAFGEDVDMIENVCSEMAGNSESKIYLGEENIEERTLKKVESMETNNSVICDGTDHASNSLQILSHLQEEQNEEQNEMGGTEKDPSGTDANLDNIVTKKNCQTYEGNQDYLLWELGIKLKVIAKGSKYKGLEGVFKGVTSSKKSIYIDFEDGTKQRHLKPTSVRVVGIELSTLLTADDSGNNLNDEKDVVDPTPRREQCPNISAESNRDQLDVQNLDSPSDLNYISSIAEQETESETFNSPKLNIPCIELDDGDTKPNEFQASPKPSSDLKSKTNINNNGSCSNEIDGDHTQWNEGIIVEVICGKYKGLSGTFTGLTKTKKSVRVNLDDGSKTTLRPKSVQPVYGSRSQQSLLIDQAKNAMSKTLGPESFKPVHVPSSQQTLLVDQAKNPTSEILSKKKSQQHKTHASEVNISPHNVGDTVYCVGGKYNGKRGKVEKICPKTLKVAIEGENNVIGTIHLKYIRTAEGIQEEEVNDFRLPDYKSGGISFGNRRVTRLLSQTEASNRVENESFISHMVGRRIITNQVKLNRKNSEVVDKKVVVESSTFELVLSKLVESDGGGLYKPKEIQYIYMQTEGPGLETVSAKDEFEKIADFSALKTRKAKSRLELFASPAYKCPSTGKHLLKMLDQSLFVDIEEKGHVGCGFICENLLLDVLGHNSIAQRAMCIQVRIFIPMKGGYKGMLMKKRIASGPKIQLPESMKKIPASRNANPSKKGCLLITAAGVDPSTPSTYMGRLPSIDPTRNNPPPKSFNPKELSQMLVRLFKSLDVPDELVQSYVKNSTRGKDKERLPEISHAFIRGVADPTGKIPANFVFITGMGNNDLLGDSIFITRSPVIKASDGHMVNVLRSKPDTMTEEEYEWLMAMPFGAVIFGFQNERNTLSMPERIANGDLDGDRYFVCWEKDILHHIKADEWKDIQVAEDEAESTKSVEQLDIDWFRKVQDLTTDPSFAEIGRLIGILYKSSEKAADNDIDLFMRNPDAMAFADAYYQALENGKHGTKIVLPKHLWKAIPNMLHKHLCED